MRQTQRQIDELHKCIQCGEITDNSVRISDDNGFSQSSYNAYVCLKCYKHIHIKDELFVIINKELYHEFNIAFGFFGSLQKVRSKEHLDYILNQEYYELLKEMGW